jgi:hypothetical protein
LFLSFALLFLPVPTFFSFPPFLSCFYIVSLVSVSYLLFLAPFILYFSLVLPSSALIRFRFKNSVSRRDVSQLLP